MAAKWDSQGFCHGILQPKHMSVLGLTLDLEECEFQEYFNENYIPNHSYGESYRYGAQKEIVKFNMYKLTDFLKEHIGWYNMTDYVHDYFDEVYRRHYYQKMAMKMGFLITKPI